MASAAEANGVFLPRLARPTRYEIFLAPDLVACTFRGRETVSVEVAAGAAGVREVVLHSLHLHVFEVSFTAHGGKKLAAEKLAFDLKKQSVTLGFGEDLASGELSLSFSGVLNDELAGFYRSKYTTPAGEARYMAVTQHEATDARRTFPCIDEPAAKASYKITVEAPASRQVISNMHVLRIDSSADGKVRTHHFAESPVMSTYLTAVCVGEWDTVEGLSPRLRIPTRVFCPLAKASQGQFALSVALPAIDYLEQLFGVPFMGTKSDLLAIPDFSAGAMENLGCVTYREAAVLIDEKESSFAMRQRVAQVVAHELSHMWFGNYVTMQWWTHLWLNEGFASHVEYVVQHHLFPSWGMWSVFVATTQSAAFSLDSMASTHPVEIECETVEQIDEIFDIISYRKGSSIIRMLFSYLGYDVAFKGLTSYLKAFAYKNAVTEDLWGALAEASGKPVAAIMRRWTAMSGYPYLHVSQQASGALALSSRRFISAWARDASAWPTDSDFAEGPSVAAAAAAAAKRPLGADAKPCDANDDWCVPLSVVVPSSVGSVETRVLDILLLDPDAGAPAGSTREAKLAAAAADLSRATAGAAFFKLNADHASFYRTVYDNALLKKLLPAVATPADRSRAPLLGESDRLGLIGDVAAAVSVGMASPSSLLALCHAARFDTAYNVWVAMMGGLGDIKEAADALGDVGAFFSPWLRELLRPVVELVGFDARAGEHSNTALLRALVLRYAAVCSMQNVVAECLARFDAYVKGAPLAADIKQLVFSTAASHGGAARYEQLTALLSAATMSEEQRRLMTALGRASEPALLARTLALVLSDKVRLQDVMIPVGSVASNPGDVGRTLAWRFVVDNWAVLHEKVGATFGIWAHLLGAATGSFASKAMADEISAFFETHPAGAAARTIKQSVEGCRSRAWRVHLLKADIAGLTKGLAE